MTLPVDRKSIAGSGCQISTKGPRSRVPRVVPESFRATFIRRVSSGRRRCPIDRPVGHRQRPPALMRVDTYAVHRVILIRKQTGAALPRSTRGRYRCGGSAHVGDQILKVDVKVQLRGGRDPGHLLFARRAVARNLSSLTFCRIRSCCAPVVPVSSPAPLELPTLPASSSVDTYTHHQKHHHTHAQ